MQAVNTQEANKAASNRLPPLWAMVAMVLLGWNEAMAILTSPLKLVLLVVTLLFAKTVYQELEVDTEMQHGLLPGCVKLAAKFVPTMKQVQHAYTVLACHALSQYCQLHGKSTNTADIVVSTWYAAALCRDVLMSCKHVL